MATLPGEFIAAFPELEESYRDEDEFWQDDEGSNVSLNVRFVLAHEWIRPLLAVTDRTPDQDLALVRAFEFLERMYDSDDLSVVAIADTGVIEGFCDHAGVRDVLPLMPRKVRYWTEVKIGIPHPEPEP
ncbi:MAG TPA: hypothetical protein VHN98_09915 [Acidimicrobiales bacterium]|nr:hypothetical protein [Acidimicrobiales bacterium]